MAFRERRRQRVPVTRGTTQAPKRRPTIHPLHEAALSLQNDAHWTRLRVDRFGTKARRGNDACWIDRATQGEGVRLGRVPSKTGRSSPERPDTFAVQIRRVPRCVHT